MLIHSMCYTHTHRNLLHTKAIHVCFIFDGLQMEHFQSNHSSVGQTFYIEYIEWMLTLNHHHHHRQWFIAVSMFSYLILSSASCIYSYFFWAILAKHLVDFRQLSWIESKCMVSVTKWQVAREDALLYLASPHRTAMV